MQSMIDAIIVKLTDSALFNTVGGRIYQDIAPGLDCPYVVWSIVSSVPSKTFSEVYSDTLIQFSLFGSKAGGQTQMGTMYANLHALLDEKELTITGSTLVWMRETNLVTMTQALDTPLPDGSDGMYLWAVDFEVYTSLN